VVRIEHPVGKLSALNASNRGTKVRCLVAGIVARRRGKKDGPPSEAACGRGKVEARAIIADCGHQRLSVGSA